MTSPRDWTADARLRRKASGVTLAIDIGGTFTDVVLELYGERFTTKVLTTPAEPDVAFMEGALGVLERAGIEARRVELIIHGTTLATNAIIERKGAEVALLCTEGFRDSLEMAYEHRFEQSDLFMERPAALVPRHRRLPVRERVAADGSVLVPLEEGSVERVVPALREAGVEAVAIGFIHSYANPEHERRTAEIISRQLPSVPISLSSDVSPEIREYDRISTTVANAYVQPLMSGFLQRLEGKLRIAGFACPMLMMMSSGGMTTVEIARRYPVRLIESGPAGGAILARTVAAECGLREVLSFDMGGTTAKISFIDDCRPQVSRAFEVARQYRFLRGSGFPLRIPVIDMVEIGAGGGSIAALDALRRIAVGPESAGASPGPACYGRGGTRPTVTDADLVMGRIDPERFAGGRVGLEADDAREALLAHIGVALGMTAETAAAGVAEMVDENMRNAARVHGIECGKELAPRTLVAFGGAAPLHACRVADKLGIGGIVIPTGAGVGSAIGFLRADIAYEVVRTRHMDLRRFDPDVVNELFGAMRRETEAVVRLGAPDAPLVETRTAFMRYRGQGHEITVPVPERPLERGDEALLVEAFEGEYRALYGRIIPKLSLEAMSWSLALSTDRPLPERAPEMAATRRAEPRGARAVLDPDTDRFVEVPVYLRAELAAGARVPGPALIVEDETSTLVTARYDAAVNALGYLVLTRKDEP
jgi:N-methylhydantoinase A